MSVFCLQPPYGPQYGTSPHQYPAGKVNYGTQQQPLPSPTYGPQGPRGPGGPGYGNTGQTGTPYLPTNCGFPSPGGHVPGGARPPGPGYNQPPMMQSQQYPVSGYTCLLK